MSEIDLGPADLGTVLHILGRHVPDREVAAFGSRARWEASDSSDLDLAILGNAPVPLDVLAALRSDFEESNLSFTVDVVDWATIRPSFRSAVEGDLVRLQEPKAQTAISDWHEVRLDDVAQLFDGPHATPAKTNEGPIFLGIGNLEQGRLNLAQVEHLSEVDFVRWTRRVAPESGDLVFSYETRLGEAALIPPGLRCCLGRRMGLLRPNRTKVDPRFLLYAYLGPEFQETLRSRTIHGSTVDRLPLLEMPDFPLRLPKSLTEQRAIARILSALDDKIELNRRMSATLEEMARALFRSWFVDFDPVGAKAEGRDPGLPAEIAALFPDRFEESELGEIPAGWEVRRLEDLCRSIFSGGTPSTQRADFWDGGIPWLSSGETRTRIIIETERTISTTGVEYSSTRLARRGTTVIASAGQGTTRGQTSWLSLESYVNQSVVVVEADRDLVPDSFVFFDLERRYDEFRRLSDGHSSRGSLTTKLLAALPVVVPQNPLLIKFASLAASCLDRSCSLQLESRTLAALRDSLLPKLISGELRVPEELLELASEAPAG